VAAGIGLALAATRLTVSFLYGLAPHDPATFAAAIVLLGAIAVVASLIPARRAAKVDPMVALRDE
jgi:putative ABC transport system permease protein